MADKAYPEWQRLIRSAQDKSKKEQQRIEEEQRAALAEEIKRQALALKKALAYCGIEAEPSEETGVWLRDGYKFEIHDIGSVYDYRDIQYLNEREDRLKFTLSISRQLPETDPADTESYVSEVITSHHTDNDKVAAAVADTLDEIDFRWRLKVEARNGRSERAQSESKPEATLTEQLAALLRAIVREEMETR